MKLVTSRFIRAHQDIRLFNEIITDISNTNLLLKKPSSSAIYLKMLVDSLIRLGCKPYNLDLLRKFAESMKIEL